MIRQDIRNICIIAHVDHGKTTLVDHLLRQSGQFAAHKELEDRVMDSNDLERERGITILAKNCSASVDGVRINIVDTPGHADFGGEVERILGTVDGAILLVDAAEGPLPQTRFVLSKALEKGHKIILCINKVDRPEVQGTGRIEEVVNAAFDLFVELGASEEQCDFPIIYACAREGWCTDHSDQVPEIMGRESDKGTLKPLFDKILSFLPGPNVDPAGEFKMQLANLGWSDYVGQMAVGRVVSGVVKKKDQIFVIGETAPGVIQRRAFQVTKVSRYVGNREEEVESLSAGDIGILAGCDEINIGDTIAGNKDSEPFPRIAVDAPTLRMIFTINTSPMSGKDGEAIQSRKLKERLLRECRANVAVRYEDGETSEQFFLLGRGELQFSILIEQMRREGLEFMVGKPIVLMKQDEQGNLLEPIESAVLDLPSAFSGEVTELFQGRKGILSAYENLHGDRVRLVFEIPSRGLLGVRTHYLTATRGQGLFSSEIKGYEPFRGEMIHRKNGSLVADRAGKTTDYALVSLEELGMLFIGPGTQVYEGMIVGECSRANDINVNPTKEKKLTNIRAAGSDGLTILSGTRDMNLEACIEWIEEDEWIEVTPLSVRLRKKVLPQNLRSVIRGKK